MERYGELKEMLHAELNRIQQKGELSAASLAQADTIAHTLKDISTVEAMEKAEGGYSEHYPAFYRTGYYGYDDGGSYGPGRGRGSNARRDSMGRYASESRYSSEGRRGGSYDEGESMESYRNR